MQHRLSNFPFVASLIAMLFAPPALAIEKDVQAHELMKVAKQYTKDGRPEAALPIFAQSLALYDKDPETFIKRAETYLLLDRYQLALNDCNAALKLLPTSGYALYRKGCAEAGLKQYQPALRDVSKSIALKSRPRAFYIRAEIEVALKQFKPALADYQTFIAKASQGVEYNDIEPTYLKIAECYGALNDKPNQIATLRSAYKGDPTNPEFAAALKRLGVTP